MNLIHALIAIVLISAAWHVAATLLIYEDLRKRNRNPSFLLLRLISPVYASEYREITVAETGRTGPLFWHWLSSINVALLATIAAVPLLR